MRNKHRYHIPVRSEILWILVQLIELKSRIVLTGTKTDPRQTNTRQEKL